MNIFFSNPDLYLYIFDTFMTLLIYVFSIVLFLKQKREYIAPLLIFGLFLFPIQFSIWFLKKNIESISIMGIGLFEIIYQLFLKLSLILTIIFSKNT